MAPPDARAKRASKTSTRSQIVTTSRKSMLCSFALLLCFNAANLSAQSATSKESQCFGIHVHLNGKPLDRPQVITLKTKQDESTVSLEQGCFKVPSTMLNETAVAVSFTLPGNKIDIGTVATGFFTGVWDVEL